MNKSSIKFKDLHRHKEKVEHSNIQWIKRLIFSCGSKESLVDTTISISKMLFLCFIILYLAGDQITTHSIHHTENFLTFEPIFILYCIKFSLIN